MRILLALALLTGLHGLAFAAETGPCEDCKKEASKRHADCVKANKDHPKGPYTCGVVLRADLQRCEKVQCQPGYAPQSTGEEVPAEAQAKPRAKKGCPQPAEVESKCKVTADPWRMQECASIKERARNCAKK